MATVSMFIALFGAGYLWCAIAGRADRVFITLAAVGKIGFFSILAWLWFIGQFDIVGPLLGLGDLAFGLIFVAWLAGVSPAPLAHPAAASARR
jgi:hypothetical protein